jgi:hypothetical protein
MFRDGHLKCASCGQEFDARLAYPQAPRGGAPVTRTSVGRTPVFIVSGAVFAIVLAGFLVMWLSSSGGSDRQTRPAVNQVSTGTEPAPAPQSLYAEVAETVLSGRASTFAWWVVSYRNAGSGVIASPRIKASIRDEKGNIVHEEEHGAPIVYLPPGETVWIYVSPRNLVGTDAEFKVVDLKAPSQWLAEHKRLEVSDLQVTPQESPHLAKYPFLTGRVRNHHHDRMRVVTLQAVAYNEQGEPCGYASGYATPSNLAPGEAAEFKLHTGAFVNETPARWELKAWGAVRK